MTPGERDELAATTPGSRFAKYPVVEVGHIRVVDHIAIWDGMEVGHAERYEAARVSPGAVCRPQEHQVLSVGVGNKLLAVIVRRPGAQVATWRVVDVGFDYDGFSVIGPDPLPPIVWPTSGEDRQWVVIDTLPDGRGFVRIEDPSGSDSITVHAGIDADGALAMMIVELYG